MAERRIYDDQLHAQFVTFSCDRRRRLLDMHRNPVRAGLVPEACEWRWSSARYYEQAKSVGVPLGWGF